ncbi:MAG TPA: M1 family metallopeptidase [Chthoniobacterales bacterium]|nr:M1 family metallopeptidase [Chthoniobacterales bacterium]
MRTSLTHLLLILVTLTANAQEKFAFQNAPGKLPKTVVPRHYIIHLEPDLDQMSTEGAEGIEIEVLKPSSQIVLNAVETEIWNASLAHGSSREGLKPQFDATNQVVQFTASMPLQPGSYTLSFSFRSKISSSSRGLFAQSYDLRGKAESLLATRFEPANARRAFPCWDEPAFRATFQLSVKTLKKNTAVSNMPTVAEHAFGSDQKIVIFERTPPMASYLVALVCGKLEWLEDQVAGIRLRILTTPGKKEFGEFALENTKKLLEYYNDYFGIHYPLPKLDQIALPINSGSAMENWGAITSNENLLLFDPAKSSSATQEQVFTVLAHEIAHQWFGDLVTVGWWDNLWLSESFATWMERKAEEHLYPQWRGWLRACEDRERAMFRDAQEDTHPIQQPINGEEEAMEAFDDITYWKGQYFIRMLEGFLGDDAFRDGIRLYLRENQFSNANAINLWNALEKSSGRSVTKLASTWIEQSGFPLVKVTAECLNQNQVVTLEQSRFSFEPSDSVSRPWIVPIGILSTADAHRPRYALLEKITENFDFPGCDGALNANADSFGFYRVWYDPDLLGRLGRDWNRLSEEERVDFVSDTWAMVMSNRTPVTSYLALLDRLRSESSYSVWHNVIGALTMIDRLERGQSGRAAFQAYVCILLGPLFQGIGWEAKPDEELATKLLRSDLIQTLGRFGDRVVIDEAFRRFEESRKGGADLSPDLRRAVTEVVGRYSSPAVYNELNECARQAPLLDAKQDFYHALEVALDPDLADRTLQLALTMSPAESRAAFSAVAVDGEHAELVWQYTKNHLDDLHAQYDEKLWSDLLPKIAEGFNSSSYADELVKLAQAQGSADSLSKARAAADQLRFRAKLKDHLLPAVDDWVLKKLDGRTQAAVSEQ